MCASSDCGWLFVDVSRRRRWCLMRGCGNWAEAARYYQRHKSSWHPWVALRFSWEGGSHGLDG
jgi:predicted RNA-binding Zn ribbon-like protein